MPVYLADLDDRPADAQTPRKVHVVHVRRPGETARDPALCGDRFGAYISADSDDALPPIITGLEVLCVECKQRQFPDFDDPLGNAVWEHLR